MLSLVMFLAMASPAAATVNSADKPAITRKCLGNRQIQTQRSSAEAGYFAKTQQGWWHNTGPACPSFGRNRALISYRPTHTQCRGDVVNLVDTFTGVNFGNCVLGDWQSVVDADVPPASTK